MLTGKIKTNNVPRPVLTWSDMDLKQQAQIEYERGLEEARYFIGFQYKGFFFDMSLFGRIKTVSEQHNSPDHHARTVGDGCELASWHGYGIDTWSEGMVIKFVGGDESVVVGNEARECL